ncbi:DNA polymerase III subunit delta [Arenimonas composti]|uniref:DNA polymerase III subunit delta n=1 Tax=Arenimonas composti TR7-09 = DSM 18010 TaxID=1121013 RepID=A0A091BD40_9GAMM|nr:DNA polymerase III subunit delta [Arenimonas composti]KFN49656.1 hypothetical protein P873_09825 [Arenimonas composti TR7-09 = DSM 18010]
MELRPDRLERQLAGEPLRPVYLVAGTEPLRVQEAADAIRAKARAEGYGEREIYDIEKGFDWNQLTQGLATMSLFASRRLFELRMPSGKPDKDGSEAIREYCEKTPPDTVLLVVANDWSSKHGGKWSEAIQRAGHSVIVWPLKTHELGDWLLQRLRSRGLVATPDAVQLLADRVEGNLLAAAQEIDKLVLAAGGDAGPIDAARMQELVADSSRFDVFKLVDAALSGESARAVRMLHALRGEGEQVAGLMPMIAKEVLTLCGLARAAAERRLQAAMREARIWDSKMAAYKRAAERHPPERWERFAAECGRIDRTAKGRGDGDPWLQLERLLVAIADARGRRLLAS